MKCKFCTSNNTELKKVVERGDYSQWVYDCNNCGTPFTMEGRTDTQMIKHLTDAQLKEKISDKLYELTTIEENRLRGVGCEEWNTVTDEYESLLREYRNRNAIGY